MPRLPHDIVRKMIHIVNTQPVLYNLANSRIMLIFPVDIYGTVDSWNNSASIYPSLLIHTVNQLIFESEKVSKVVEKPFRKLFNFEKSRGVCTGFNLYSNVGIARR